MNKLLILISFAAVTAGCRDRQPQVQVQPTAPSAAPEVVLRSYDVPTGQGEQVRSILSGAFQGLKDEVAARATLSPDGQLVVVAPESIQSGVADLVAEMAKRPPPAAPPTIELEYWLVAGRPVAERTGDFGPLDHLGNALQIIEQSHGSPMEFSLLESLRLRTLTDGHGFVAGRYARVSQTATLSGGKVVADIECATGPTRFETRVAIDPGQWLILGEVGYDPLPDMWKKPGPSSTLFLVVEAKVSGQAN